MKAKTPNAPMPAPTKSEYLSFDSTYSIMRTAESYNSHFLSDLAQTFRDALDAAIKLETPQAVSADDLWYITSMQELKALRGECGLINRPNVPVYILADVLAGRFVSYVSTAWLCIINGHMRDIEEFTQSQFNVRS
jgi:hypothetical protein